MNVIRFHTEARQAKHVWCCVEAIDSMWGLWGWWEFVGRASELACPTNPRPTARCYRYRGSYWRDAAHNAVLPREINDAAVGDVTAEQRRVIRSTECVQCVIRQRCRQLPLTDKPNRPQRPSPGLRGHRVAARSTDKALPRWPLERRRPNRSCVFGDLL